MAEIRNRGVQQFARVGLSLVFAFVATAFQAGQPQTPGTETTVRGTVFEDLNGNGQFDTGEPGIAGVAVSNQEQVVQTGADGRYALPVDDQTIIFITQPAGYAVPLNENNLPQFYRIHQPAGSPPGLKYPGVAPTGALPESVDFPLLKRTAQDTFTAIITGDPQPANLQQVQYYRDDVVTEMARHRAAFYLALGDIVHNDLALYVPLNRVVAQLGIPVYNVPGNHDTNYRAKDDRFAMETFHRTFGPEYFSFDYGQVHFIVLDDVEYQGWNSAKDKPGGYRGFISEKQLTWLANDLALVPRERLVVLSMHIPLYTATNQSEAFLVVNRDRVFDLLRDRRHLLALSGHLHVIENFDFTADMGWPGAGRFVTVNPGAGCGAWWSGPNDVRGIPETLCTDGSPNGYFVFTFEGSAFRYHFYPVNHDRDAQMRIISPPGTLARSELPEARILVNVFTGRPDTKVLYRLDGGAPEQMLLTPMRDAFMERHFETYRATLPDWLKTPDISTHIWSAPLPESLLPGTHRLQIQATDWMGNRFEAIRLFEIIP